ncbi:HDOD domain-containing protein [Deferrisoma camini]|uniref:HDOD domain-containing protein n=1 Tax=Deferrisoma camini TaxID=1035120 RepID=UPI00046CABEE|nr:HDOD domain-containing protein [Deferrisoma camini]
MNAPSPDRFAFLDEIQELPSLPQVLVGVSRVASDPTSNAGDLAGVILKDQALTMKVLRVANSARYAVTSARVTTVSRAVVLLGFESVRAIALGIGAYHLLSSLRKGGEIVRGFWTHAVGTAVVAQELADLLRYDVPEEAFVAGLLHDVGKLVLAHRWPDRAAEVYGVGLRGPALLKAENRAFGVDHVETGTELARRWELPEVLQAALARHHRTYHAPPAERADRLAFLVVVAKALAEPLWAGAEPHRDLAASMARVLRKPVGMVLDALGRVPAKVREYARFFEIQVEDLKTYTLWVEQENQRLQEVFADREAERRRAERREAELAAIREIHGRILEGRDTADVAALVLRRAADIVGAARLVALQVDAGRLKPAASFGDVTPDFLEALALSPEPGGAVTTVLQGEPLCVVDRDLPYYHRVLTPAEAEAFDARCFVLLPLGPEGAVRWILYADREDDDEPFDDEEVESLSALGNLIPLAAQTAKG